MTKFSNISFLILVYISLALSACTASKKIIMSIQGNPYDGDLESIDRGKPLYLKNCSSCHGKDAKGNNELPTQLSLQGPSIIEKSAKAIAFTAAYGKGELMPAFEETLSDNQIWDIANYVKTLK